MRTIIVYAPQQSARLEYVLDWLLASRLKVPYTLVHHVTEIPANTFFIAYGAHFIHALSIPAAGLLTEAGIHPQTIAIDKWYDMPTLYATTNKKEEDYTLPFDVLSALFFLLCRYEEYYTYTPDKHGRYPAAESILFKNGWLRRPLVDEWVHTFGQLLESYTEPLPKATFHFQPTYDIDIAYSYTGKGIQRNAGGFAKDALAGNMQLLRERAAVLAGSQQDPYDSFEWLTDLHKTRHISPVYFILCALRNTAHDKNILPGHPLMIELIKRLQQDGGNVFIHPSYYALGGDAIEAEKKALEQITRRTISSSRQHYIKNVLPRTYRQLSALGITSDHSMGYATHLGFRAGTGSSFAWYDLEREVTTPLIIHPFCFMDTAALYEEKLDVTTAFTALHLMAQILKQTNGTLTTIFHNFSLGSSREWKGWAHAYKEFVEEFA